MGASVTTGRGANPPGSTYNSRSQRCRVRTSWTSTRGCAIWPTPPPPSAELDLVITVDTAVAHLAGALGKPVWVLLPHVPDWRWMLGRDDSPWYPTMRLFRQPAVNAWEPAIASVARELSSSVRSGTPSSAAVKHARRPRRRRGGRGDFLADRHVHGLGHVRPPPRACAAALVRRGAGAREAPMLQGIGPLAERRVREMRRASTLADRSSTIRLTALGNHVRGAPRIGGRPGRAERRRDLLRGHRARRRSARPRALVRR